MSFLEWLQGLSFSVWVSESDTVWGYPAILTLHTIGFGILVGANVVVDLRLLGVARSVRIEALRALFGPMWLGLVINVLTGVTLFMAAATEKGVQTVFFVKLTFIAAALVVMLRIAVDLGKDPTSHNLWPFEVVLAAFVGAVASGVGLGIGFLLRRR